MIRNDNSNSGIAELTRRQKEVMDLLSLHMTSKQIAAELNISPKTVDLHVDAARAKLGGEDRYAAARAWRELTKDRERFPTEISRVDAEPDFPHSRFRDLPKSPLFTVSDVSNFEAWPIPQRSRPFLETIDERFGKFGRLAAIVVLAGFLAMTIVLSLAIAEGLDKLM